VFNHASTGMLHKLLITLQDTELLMIGDITC